MKWVNKKIELSSLSIFLVYFGFILVVFILILFLIGEVDNFMIGNIKADKFGQFGDFVGGVVGSLWALAGVLLFYVALRKQIEALENQKDATNAANRSIILQSQDLALQRTELQQTREVLQEQREILKIQQFESTYFNLINLLISTLNAIDFRDIRQLEKKAAFQTYSDRTINYFKPEYEHITEIFIGRDCILIMLNNINYQLNNIGETFKTRSEVLNHFALKYESEIEPYINLIKQILIKVSNCPKENNQEYIDILTAQLSTNELKFIYLLTETTLIDEDYKNLLLNYGILNKIII